MRLRTSIITAAAVLFAAAWQPASALAADSESIAEINRKIEVLTGEIERLKLGEAAEPELSSVMGFGPGASKVYKKGVKRVSIGGYGEMVYNNNKGRRQSNAIAGAADTLDLLRAIIYVGYKFNDWITFNSEIEFEHASDNKRGEVSVEMLQIDLKPWDYLGFRAGLLLVPMGLINEMHEPTTFHGANRPNVERNIIPATWRENGAGIFGTIGPVSYKSYLVAGLQATSNAVATPATTGFNSAAVGGFSHSSGIRGGRSSGSKSLVNDFAWVSRLDVRPIEGLMVGSSLYIGEADQKRTAHAIPVTFWDVHGTFEYEGLEVKGLYVVGRIGNADVVNAANGRALGATNGIGSHLFGGYGEVAYEVFQHLPFNTEHRLSPFFRYERYDTQRKTPNGWLKNPANSRTEYTWGLTYKPHSQVVLKADIQALHNQGQTGVGRTNLAIGYIF